MSLINQMLQDLESRKNPQVDSAPKKPVYEDLRPISPASRPRAASRRLAGAVSAVVVLGLGVYAWMQWGDNVMSLVSPDKPAAKPASVARKTPPRPAFVAPAPMATSAAAAAVSASTSPAPAEAATPPAAPENKALPAPQQTPAAAEPAPVAKKDYWIVSPGETLYSISTKTGVDLWDLSRWNGLGREHVIRAGQRLRLTPPASGQTAKSGERQTVKADKPRTPAKAPAKRETLATAGAGVSGNESDNAVMDRKLKPLSAEEKAESEYRRAVGLLEKGRASDAEKHLKAALNASETHTQARELYAGLMLQQGHWRETQQLLEKGIEKVPDYYPFAQLLARVYVEHGADQKALAIMEQSRRAAADNPDYTAFLAALYQRAGKHPDAVRNYKEALALHPQEARWWLGMGISLEAMQDWSTARAAYQRAIDSGALDDNLLQYARQRLTVVKNK